MPSSPSSPLETHELHRLAALARLDPSREPLGSRARSLVRGLRAVLEYVGRLEPRGPVETLSPLASGHACRLRPDEPRPSLARDRVLAAAPERLGDLFGVTRVLGPEP